MAESDREKFVTKVTSETLAAMNRLAKVEGRQIESLVDEAFADLIEKRNQERLRAHVMSAYQASHEKYAELYKRLAE